MSAITPAGDNARNFPAQGTPATDDTDVFFQDCRLEKAPWPGECRATPAPARGDALRRSQPLQHRLAEAAT